VPSGKSLAVDHEAIHPIPRGFSVFLAEATFRNVLVEPAVETLQRGREDRRRRVVKGHGNGSRALDQESGRDWRRADGPRHCVRPLSLLEVSTSKRFREAERTDDEGS
jgi:hypothetical protein